jgi:predicted PurR-regulated permease PerM
MLDRLREKQRNGTVTPIGIWMLVVITGVVLYLCWTMVAPFVSVLTWALALAIVTNPLRRILHGRLSRTAVALLIVSVVVAVLAVPTIFMSHRLMGEVMRGQQVLRGALQATAWQHALESQPWLGAVWRWLASRVDLSQIVQQASAALANRIAPAVGWSALVLSQAAMSLLFFFFFVRDQEALLDSFRHFIPLTPSEIDTALDRVSSAIRAAVYGRVLIGSIQGLVGGVVFYAVGIPAPLFWTVMMAVLSMLPVVGAFVVWIPAAAVLFATGQWIRALIVVSCGIAIIHPIDNVLYPLLVGPRMGLHPLVLLIAFVGGLIAFGAAGLILGPAIVALAFALGEIWSHRDVA